MRRDGYEEKFTASAIAVIFTLLTPLGLLPAQVFADSSSPSPELIGTWLTDGGEGCYYKQLSDEHKAAWSIDIDNILAYPGEIHNYYGKEPDYKFQALDRMIPADNHKLFWLDWINYRARLCYYISSSTSQKYEPIWPENMGLDDLKTAFLAAIESDKAAISAMFPEKAVDLVNALADFGHYVQPILSETNGWNLGTDHAAMNGSTEYTSENVNAAKSAAEKYKFEISRPENCAITGLSYALNLETKTAVRIFVTVQDGSEISASVNGLAAECKLQSDGRYCIEIGDISAHELADAYSVTITVDGASVSITNLSALSYVNTVLSSHDPTDDASYAVTSLYNYYVAADNYIKG